MSEQDIELDIEQDSEQELEQHEIDALSGNESIYGFHQDAHHAQVHGEGSHQGMTDGTISAVLHHENGEKTQEKKREKHDTLFEYISHQIAHIHEEIKHLEERHERYKHALAHIDERDAELDKTLRLSEDAMAVLKDLEKQGESHLNVLKDYYQDRIFSMDKDNAWEALRKNIIRDDDGHMVYKDKQHRFYRLELDAEGEPIDDPESGLPMRIYYESADDYARFMHEAYVGEPPKIFANETPLGKDTSYDYSHADNMWIYFEIDTEPGRSNPVPDEYTNYTGSVEFVSLDTSTDNTSTTIQSALKVCSAYTQCAMTEQTDLDQERKLVREQMALNNEQLEIQREKLKFFEEKKQSGEPLTAQDKKDLAEAKKSYEEAETAQKQLQGELDELENNSYNMSDFLGAAPGTSGGLSFNFAKSAQYGAVTLTSSSPSEQAPDNAVPDEQNLTGPIQNTFNGPFLN